jgi:diguanylate cyclase (GGDEF)-like protein
MKNKPIHILLIEDNPEDARLMEEILTGAGAGSYTLHHVERVKSALQCLDEQDFDVVLLDLSLQDGRGLDTVKRICTACQQIPVIVLTGLEDDALAVSAIQAGAQDYLVRGHVEGHEITRAIRYAIERKRLVERLQYQATHDGLTGLPNRQLFQDRLEHALEHARRKQKDNNADCITSVMLLDIDNFRDINSTLGHAQGDELLRLVAQRLQGSIRKSDTAARIGGDEFTIVNENICEVRGSEKIARKILQVLSEPFVLDGQPVQITVSLGISLFPFDGDNARTLLKVADQAMYQAKEKGIGFWIHSHSEEKYDE